MAKKVSKKRNSARLTPSSVAQTISENQWVDFVESKDASGDQLVLVDAAAGARIAVDHQSWNDWVEAIEYFAAGHCERADCYGIDPTQVATQVESLAAVIGEVDEHHTMDPDRLAAALMARGVSGPSQLVQRH